jgi:hypothetical protein
VCVRENVLQKCRTTHYTHTHTHTFSRDNSAFVTFVHTSLHGNIVHIYCSYGCVLQMCEVRDHTQTHKHTHTPTPTPTSTPTSTPTPTPTPTHTHPHPHTHKQQHEHAKTHTRTHLSSSTGGAFIKPDTKGNIQESPSMRICTSTHVKVAN